MFFSIRNLLDTVLLVFSYLVLARCILSFMAPMSDNKIVRLIYDVTEPVMAPFRKLLPPMSGMDFSPILLFLAISLLRSII